MRQFSAGGASLDPVQRCQQAKEVRARLLTKCGMRGWVWIQRVDADQFVIRAGCQKLVTARKAHSMDRASVITQGSKLLWLAEISVGGVIYCFRRPYANVAIYSPLAKRNLDPR